MISALEWGLAHGSCATALEWRESLGPEATQADAWRLCRRGDWLLWQWAELPPALIDLTRPAIRRAIDRIVVRAIRRGQRAVRGVEEPWSEGWEHWARAWLTGEQRSCLVASRAALASEAGGWSRRAAVVARRAAVTAAVSVPRSPTRTWEVATSAEMTAQHAGLGVSTERRAQARDIHRELPEWSGWVTGVETVSRWRPREE